MEEDAGQQDEQRRFNRERPEAVPIRVEDREAIRLRERPQDPGEHSDENFNTVIPNAPKITSGKVVAHSDGVPALV